ncbi:hypothetical protein [Nostoc sp.]|uniref:hypothetical protein n=1 Tax=Nostoc sp. TaxID=1180 RepID=UPI002FF6FACD
MMPFNVALASGNCGVAEFLFTVDHNQPRLGYEFAVVVGDVGDELFTTVNLVVVGVDFYSC